MSVLIKGLEMPETGYMDVRIFRDGTATIATGTKPYYRELKAEPVRHGKWIWKGEDGDSRWTCSECKCKEYVPTCNGVPDIWEYCPNCGCRMDAERKEE